MVVWVVSSKTKVLAVVSNFETADRLVNQLRRFNGNKVFTVTKMTIDKY